MFIYSYHRLDLNSKVFEFSSDVLHGLRLLCLQCLLRWTTILLLSSSASLLCDCAIRIIVSVIFDPLQTTFLKVYSYFNRVEVVKEICIRSSLVMFNGATRMFSRGWWSPRKCSIHQFFPLKHI